uniref:Uncharacterized protein n=1 Tax=viral metagenome TaxID=1070528 RepID=A0A6M3LXH2_9ZZZZ
MTKDDEPVFNFEPTNKTEENVHDEIDKVITKKMKVEDRVRIAHEIKKNPPTPGYMKTEVPPGIYSIDLNIDAHWWFHHVCTVFPFLLDQGIRTHMDLKDSFKPEKRLPDFNYMFLFVAIVGVVGIIMVTKMFGWW